MAKTMRAFLLFAFICAIASPVVAGQFQSEIVNDARGPLTIDVPEDHYLDIQHFSQEGGSTRGVVTVTTNGRTATALTATIVDPNTSPAPDKGFSVGGPATVTVAPVNGANLFITYRKHRETTPTPTPTATATATTTPTPTPTPTATP